MGGTNDKNVQLLNEVERISHQDKRHFTPSDALLSAVFLFPDKLIAKQREYNATVELHGYYTRGQMVLEQNDTHHNVCVIELVHEAEFKTALLMAAASV